MPEPLPLKSVLQQEETAIRACGGSGPLSALCISGGGIRSATFGLGAIQSLAEHGLLTQFDYLSTVSGGGYIGSWLTAWATRAKGLENIVPRLRTDAPPCESGDCDPVQHLREYNNYLSPKLGGFSADTWTLIATVLRNLALNWLVLVPLLLCFLMAPRILLAVAYLSQRYSIEYPYEYPRGLSTSPVVTIALPLACNFCFFFGTLHIWRYLPGIGGLNHSGSDFMKRVLTPLVSATVFFSAYAALRFWDSTFGTLSLTETLIGTIAPAVLSWLVFLAIYKPPERVHLFVSLSLAVGLLGLSLGAAQWYIANRVTSSASFTWREYVTIVPPLIGVSCFCALALFAGLSSRRLEDKDREWLSRASASILLTSVTWVGACIIVLAAPQWAFTYDKWSGGAVAGLGTVSAWASRLVRREEDGPGEQPGWIDAAVKFGPPVFVLTLAVSLAILTNVVLHFTIVRNAPWWDHNAVLDQSTWQGLLIIQAAFFGAAWLAARYVNINKFSLFGMYRDRLIRAYLGASNPQRVAPAEDTDGGPNRFTGFAQSDNLHMHELLRRPFHVVNVTLNLVGGQRLAWQQRRAQPFTITPLHCGNLDLGYRPSTKFGKQITLGTAMTISGAAASPNMGYHSSPATGFVMTLLNARLGAWLGNPGPAGAKTWKFAGPKSVVRSLLKEALGLTTNRSEYVYLSDGGHFENLGLYEMVLRGCRSIVVLDSGCDGDFTYEDLGNALRKIRIDLRIPIHFRTMPEDRRCAVAVIEYPEGEPGTIVYVKPKMLGGEPPDVTSYAKAYPDFPHQSTADQWFDESQTESYRMLGKYTMDEICAGWPEQGHIGDFANHVSSQYLGVKKAAAAI